MNHKKPQWSICPECKGRGKKSRRIRKKMRIRYQAQLEQFEQSGAIGKAPEPPKGHLESCVHCKGSGLVASSVDHLTDDKKTPADFPHIAIIGAGIGGVALAVACLHRGIPFTLFERDNTFESRSQGYGLTLQQASKAIQGLGITSLKQGMFSTRHVVHTTDGRIIGEWGMRKWLQTNSRTTKKRANVHIARQSLRLELLEQLGGAQQVQWSHQLVDITENDQHGIQLSFQVDGVEKHTTADLVVGADGIRSAVRQLSLGDDLNPLRYLGCIVILGICKLDALEGIDHELLDAATVFQTVNGHDRMYMMPFTENSVMWQFSCPMSEKEARNLSKLGTHALKQATLDKTNWHDPVPQIVQATLETDITGYPVYDRELLKPGWLQKNKKITLIGDAAHPMSPFKGQGANQALLDALSLARSIYKSCGFKSEWRTKGIRPQVLNEFESEMLTRSAIKVKDSRKAAQLLHSDLVLHKGDAPRGREIETD